MAGYQAFHPIRRSQTGHDSQADSIAVIGSTILAAFGTFGLAVSGMCITAPAPPGTLNPTASALDANDAKETSGSKLFLLTRDEPPLDSHGRSQCQL